MRWLYRRGLPHRTARNQKRARRALIGYGPVLTGRQLVGLIYPHLDGQRLPEWRWRGSESESVFNNPTRRAVQNRSSEVLSTRIAAPLAQGGGKHFGRHVRSRCFLRSALSCGLT